MARRSSVRCWDVYDFLQVPHKKPLKELSNFEGVVEGKEYLVKRNLPGQRVGAKVPWSLVKSWTSSSVQNVRACEKLKNASF